MPIVGFNFTKIKGEKKSPIEKDTKVQIKSNVDITDVKEETLRTGSDDQGLKFDFKLELNYDPEIASIELKGFVYYLDKEDKLKEIVEGWKKEKSVPPEVAQQILNLVLHRGNIKALTMEEELNIPPHLSLPHISPKQ
jgi:hypothetical protein